jgi:two-component system invasion response regulator UvrY
MPTDEAAGRLSWREYFPPSDYRMTEVLIADDHAVSRAGFRHFLEADPDITEVGEAGNGHAVLTALRAHEWTMLILDTNLHDCSWLDVLRHVGKEALQVRVLVVGRLPEEQFARHVLRAGGSGYLSKERDSTEVMRAVRDILAGRRYAGASIDGHGSSSARMDANEPTHAQLSTRELQVFRRLAEGGGVSAIARELDISVKSVSTYRARLMEKLVLDSNAACTRYALQHGLIQ